MKLTKIEQMVYDWHVFMKHSKDSLDKLINRFKVKRLLEEKKW